MSPVRTAPAPEYDPKYEPSPEYGSWSEYEPNSEHDATQAPLAERLRRRLLALDYPAFAACVCRLLEVLGYQNVRLAGRRAWKGYNRHGGGGYDLEATLSGGLAPRPVVVQIKQFDGFPVHQRNVDELRGACLRAGAAEALLVTTSAFSEVVRRQQIDGNQEIISSKAATPVQCAGLVAPVRLIDGKELVRLLICHRIGVRERGLVRRCHPKSKMEIDEAFFSVMAKVAAAQVEVAAAQAAAPTVKPSAFRGKPSALGMSSCFPTSPPLTRLGFAPSGWRVTVRIFGGDSPKGDCDGGRKDGGMEGGR